jgi:hypothetical protein
LAEKVREVLDSAPVPTPWQAPGTRPEASPAP